MASYEIERAFRQAAENLLNRKITDRELRAIIQRYERAGGTTFDRAIRGIAEGANESEINLRSKAASSDDANRVMQDLRKELDKKK